VSERREGSGGDGDRVEAILGLLRGRGGRVTTARRAIVAALLAAHAHVTAEDLTAAVQDRHPDVHASTVYRCLESLADLGVVEHVHLGHGRAVYHLADRTHQHLVCEGCGAVVEVPDDVFESLGRRLRDDYGFVIRPRHFALLGRCLACSEP
jgi:Fur family transcriptional regulator, ferric uptake regulator